MKTLLFALLLAQSQPRPCTTHLDINAATKEQLVAVKGITPELADKLIAARPYKSLKAFEDELPKELRATFAFCLNGVSLVPGNKLDLLFLPELKEREPKPPSSSIPPL